MTPELSVEHTSVTFGGLVAIADLNFTVAKGENALIGLERRRQDDGLQRHHRLSAADGGDRRFRERPITGLKPHQVAALGLVRTFQRPACSPNNTVLDNVLIGLHRGGRSAFWGTCSALPGVAREERAMTERAGKS